jgi:LysR family transcriptional regulator, low CO2-responsive transcriptional regulator
VHRSARATDQATIVSVPLEPATAIDGKNGLGDAANPSRRTRVGGGSLRHVQVGDIDPRRLRLLLEIDRTGSISAAAKRCAIGQPSASMHLRALESAVGQRLVIRNERGSKLTPAGKVVASHAAQMLGTLESMRSALNALSEPSVGELVVAASQTPSLVLVPPVLRDFSARHPGVSVNLRTLPSEMVVREVARGAVDIGIAGEVACAERVFRRQILIDELVGIAPAGLLRSDAGVVSREIFARHSLLLGPQGSSTRMITERSLACADYRPARIWTFDSSEAIKRAVADGVGVSFISQLLVGDEIERGDLVPFCISGLERMTSPIYAVQPALAELTPHAARFATLMMDPHRATPLRAARVELYSVPEPRWGGSSPTM